MLRRGPIQIYIEFEEEKNAFNRHQKQTTKQNETKTNKQKKNRLWQRGKKTQTPDSNPPAP